MSARSPLGFAARLVLAAAMLAVQPPAVAAPVDLPPEADLDQFYPDQFSTDQNQADQARLPSTRSTVPPGCSFQALFPPEGRRHAVLPSGSVLRVQVIRASNGMQTVQSWARRCASFTAPGGGGTTGKNWLRVVPADAPPAGAVGYLVSSQSPFVPDELELAGTARGATILISQSGPVPRPGPPDDDAAAGAYRAIAAKINDWRG